MIFSAYPLSRCAFALVTGRRAPWGLKWRKYDREISNMKDLVAYQDGSIVSKEIIKKPTGTTTIFAFDRD